MKQFLYHRGCIIRTITEAQIVEQSARYAAGSIQAQNIEKILALDFGEEFTPRSGVATFIRIEDDDATGQESERIFRILEGRATRGRGGRRR